VLLQKLGKKKPQALPSISTKLPTVDYHVIGCGGVPRGRIVEVFGPESSGKTTITLQIIGACQAAGGVAAFVDAEHALDPRYAKKLGVDVSELLISQPDYGEQAMEVVLALVRARCVDVIVVDSVSALVPKAELEGDVGDSHMGLQARLMSQSMRMLVGEVYKAGICVIFINQIREKIGVMFGNPETTTGGRALKFYSSVRVEVRRVSNTDGGQLKDPDDNTKHVGHRMKVKNVKNKTGTPFNETVVDLYYGEGFDEKADMVAYATMIGLVTDAVSEEGKAKKGFVTFDGKDYRKNDLTEDDTFASIVSAVEKRRKEIEAEANAEAAS